ncbi:MAG TPA: HAD family phosphatase [Candidatus Acidoferrales bacterium]|nr:HAD family phosphatase [Candidatus Acidoferrales bacterium]
MAEVSALFWDVGGVILSNGWDRAARERAAGEFHLDGDEFRERHDLAVPALEAGQISLDEYLERTVFFQPRTFTREAFKAFMFAESREHPETRAIVADLARSRKYLMATINNEGLELNLHRIQQFSLHRDFVAFFSSCFLGMLKPDPAIYRLALRVTQRAPEECVFIDDRALNLECARRMGMHTIHYQNAPQLRVELRNLGVRWESN